MKFGEVTCSGDQIGLITYDIGIVNPVSNCVGQPIYPLHSEATILWNSNSQNATPNIDWLGESRGITRYLDTSFQLNSGRG